MGLLQWLKEKDRSVQDGMAEPVTSVDALRRKAALVFWMLACFAVAGLGLT